MKSTIQRPQRKPRAMSEECWFDELKKQDIDKGLSDLRLIAKSLKIQLGAEQTYMAVCPICNKEFYHGGDHDAQFKLWCHMGKDTNGKRHKSMRREMQWPLHQWTNIGFIGWT